VKRLDQTRREPAAIWLLCVDEQGIVLDDGSAAIRPPRRSARQGRAGQPEAHRGCRSAGGPRL